MTEHSSDKITKIQNAINEETKKLEKYEKRLQQLQKEEEAILARDIVKMEKAKLKRAISIGENFSTVFSNMPKEEQQKILKYCYEFSPEEVKKLYEIFELY